jgi:hypothetical protein
LTAAIAETGTLVKVVLYSLAAGIGISVVVGAGVSSIASLIDAFHEHRTAAGTAWTLLATVCLGAAVVAVALGLVVMSTK